MRPAVAALVLVAAFPFGASAADPKKPLPPGEFTGRVEAPTVQLRSRATGFVAKVAADVGQAVKKGDLLFEIDPRPYQIEVEVAKGKIGLAEAQLKLAVVQAERLRQLAKSGAVTREEVDAAEGALDIKKAELTVAKAELGKAELQLSWTKVTAPFDGKVSRRLADAGSLARADLDTLGTLVETGRLTVAFDLDEKTFLAMWEQLAGKAKGTVTFGTAADDGFPHTATVSFAAPTIDPKTGTVRVVADLANPKGEFAPGMFVKVRFPLPPKK